MFPLERSIKGRTAEAIANIIFERGGYRLAHFGIEELFREVKLLSDAQYNKLSLDPRLRALPDFLISTPDLNKAYQVEVKFRRNLDQNVRSELAIKLGQQRSHWPNMIVLLLAGEAPGGPTMKYFQNYVRVINNSVTADIISKKMSAYEFWEKLPTVQSAFPLIAKSDFKLDSVVPLLQQLAKIDVADEKH